MNNKYTKQVNCRYGRMTILTNDITIGKSLQEYGEWMEAEVSFIIGLLHAGSVVLDIGAFIGTHTLPFARSVGASGKVYAIEPVPEFFSLLSHNVADNGLTNVELINAGMSDEMGYVTTDSIREAEPFNFGGTRLSSPNSSPTDTSVRIPLKTIDEMSLDKCTLIKIDAEGMDPQIIRGGLATLKRLRPIVYAECLTLEAGHQMMEYIHSLQYCVFLHIYRMYNPNNFRGNKANSYIYSDAREPSLVLIPEEISSNVESQYLDGDELLRVYSLDDLVLGLLKWPTYKYVLANTNAARVLGVNFFANEPDLIGLVTNRKGSLMLQSLIFPTAKVILRPLLHLQWLRRFGARLLAGHPLIRARLLRLAD